MRGRLPLTRTAIASISGGLVVLVLIVAGIVFGATTATDMVIGHPQTNLPTCPSGQACLASDDAGVWSLYNKGTSWAHVVTGDAAVTSITGTGTGITITPTQSGGAVNIYGDAGATNVQTASGTGVGAIVAPTISGNALTVFVDAGATNAQTATGTGTGVTVSPTISGNALTVYVDAGGTPLLTASAPLSVSATNLTIPAADAGVNGFLYGTDWSTFNAKVDSVSGSAPIVSSGGKTPTISINAATDAGAGSFSADFFKRLFSYPNGGASQGSVIYSDGTNYVTLGPGTAGQVLATAGASANPFWNDAGTAGAVTSVTGSTPIVSSGGTTPAISINAATASAAGSVSSIPSPRIVLSGAGAWSAITSGASGPNKSELATNKVDIQTMDFSDSNSKLYAQWSTVMPSNWNASTVTATFLWTSTSTSTNSVVWGCQCRSYGDDTTLDQAFGTAQEVTDANTSTASQIHISAASSAITCAGTPAASQMVQWQCYRDSSNGSDTLAATAQLLMVYIGYTIN